jgi:hypothetical protein
LVVRRGVGGEEGACTRARLVLVVHGLDPGYLPAHPTSLRVKAFVHPPHAHPPHLVHPPDGPTSLAIGKGS